MPVPSDSAGEPLALDPLGILNTLPEYIVVLDSAGAICYFNVAWQQLAGESAGMRLGEDYLSCYEAIFSPDPIDLMALQGGLREIIGGQRERLEIEYPYQSGDQSGDQRRWFVLTALPYAGAGAVLIQHREITRRRAIEAQLHASEAELRALFAAMTDMIFVIDAHGRYLRIAETNAALRDNSVASLQGKTFHDLFPAEQAESFLGCVQRALAAGQTISTQYSMLVGGVEKWFAAAIAPFQDDRVIWVARDITESKQAEVALELLKRRQELLLNSAGEGIVGLDAQGKITFTNPVAAQLLGWAPEELIGREQHALVHHSRLDGSPYPREQCPIYAALTDGAVHRVDDEVFWRKDGTSFPVEYTSTPLREQGAIVGAVVMFKDITERRQSEQERRHQQEIIEQQAATLWQLSTPLIPISDSALLLPLIGVLDSRRAQQVMELLLAGIAEHAAEIVILDITGVPVVDAHVASVLMQVAQAVRLLGARIVLTGIRPEVAQAIVGLGADLSSIETRARLQDAIASAVNKSSR